MLLPQEGSLSIHTSLPATGDGSAPVMAVVRLLAEIRTRWAPSIDPLMCWGGAGQRDRSPPWASLCQVYWVHSMNFMPNWGTETILLCCVYYSFCCIPQLLCFEIKFSCLPKEINNQNMTGIWSACINPRFALVKELCSITEVFCHLALFYVVQTASVPIWSITFQTAEEKIRECSQVSELERKRIYLQLYNSNKFLLTMKLARKF